MLFCFLVALEEEGEKSFVRPEGGSLFFPFQRCEEEEGMGGRRKRRDDSMVPATTTLGRPGGRNFGVYCEAPSFRSFPPSVFFAYAWLAWRE